jgi:hypothetical protein
MLIDAPGHARASRVVASVRGTDLCIAYSLLSVLSHATDGPGTNSSDSAGYWGDHRCDTTPQLAQNLFEYIGALDPQPDFIIYTGDDPAHDVWKQSRTENLAALNYWNTLLNDTLAAPNSIPVFSTIGNHEVRRRTLSHGVVSQRHIR